MRLWHISDNREHESISLFVNGQIQHPYGMPGVECPACDKWATLDMLPIECPHELRKEVEAVRADQPCMPWKDYQRYRQKCEEIFRRHGVTIRLEPGSDFWPTVWQIPSRPKYEFYWGIHETIISSRIANLVEEHVISGIAISPVILKGCGTLDPDEPIPQRILQHTLSETDLLNLCPRVVDPTVYGTFYSMLALRSSYQMFVEKHAADLVICSICGSKDLPESIESERSMIETRHRERRTLPCEYVLSDDVFRSHVYGRGIVVSDKFFRILTKSDLQNCKVIELRVVDEIVTSVAPAIARSASDQFPSSELNDENKDVTDACTAPAASPSLDEKADQRSFEGDAIEEWSPMCFVSATADVGESHMPVRWMLRCVPELEAWNCGLGDMQYSGWLFMTGEEHGEEQERIGIYYLKDILEHDSAIIPYLTTPAPCRLERDEHLSLFFEVFDT